MSLSSLNEKILKCFFISHRDNKLLTVGLPVSAVLLLLLILISVFIWRWRRRPKQDEQQIRVRNGSRNNDAIYSKPEDPVIYSTINDENPNDAYKDTTTYSTIDNIPGSEAKPPAGGTVYSSVAPHQQQQWEEHRNRPFWPRVTKSAAEKLHFVFILFFCAGFWLIHWIQSCNWLFPFDFHLFTLVVNWLANILFWTDLRVEHLKDSCKWGS